MIISSIERQKDKRRFNIFVDGKFFCGLDAITMLKNHLKPGMEVDSDFLLKIKDTDNANRAKEKALDYLGYAQHSKQNLENKLKRAGFEDTYVEDAINKLERAGLIDDEKHAQNLCEYYYQRKLYGKNRVILELVKKGIDKDLAESTAQDMLPDDLCENILVIIDKKCKGKDLDTIKKDSLIRFLINYGYEYGDIKKAMAVRF